LPEEFLSLFNFQVRLSPSGLGGDEALTTDMAGAFAEVSGLEVTLENREIREGGYNAGMRQLVGKISHPALMLKRGLSLDRGFWTWIQRCMTGPYPLPYVSGIILQFSPSQDRDETAAARWEFTNGIVTKVKTADLNAITANAVPIEELSIAHEGLFRVPR